MNAKKFHIGIEHQFMPAEAVALDLYVDDVKSSEAIDQMKSIISEVGFQSDPHNNSVIGGFVNFQPFESTQENRGLVDKAVEEITSEFPKFEVPCEIIRDNDAGSVVAKRCNIQVSQ